MRLGLSLNGVEGDYMTEGKLPEEENRQAVIVGIDKYQDPAIPKLKGAKHDAEDIYDRLSNPNIGNFEIPDDHRLTGEDATCERIRKAISDIFWKTDSLDIALFYFSGHGFRDGHRNGYIAPYDMTKSEPLVKGINMRELKQVMLDSVNRSNVLMILDCCYSGISIKGDKSISDVKAPFDPYFGNLDKEKGGEGKIILASSETDQKSRETKSSHGNGGAPHHHGIFTLHLIEGLDGKAADESGIVSLSELVKYVETQMVRTGKQKPKCFVANPYILAGIKIVKTPEITEDFIQKKMEEFKKFIYKESPLDLMYAVDTIAEVLRVASIQEALDHKEELDKEIVNVESSIGDWWNENAYVVQAEIKRQSATPGTPEVFNVLEYLTIDLSFKKIKSLDNRRKKFFEYLCKVSRKNIPIELFIKQCQRYDNPPSAQKPTTVPSNEKRYDNPPSAQKPTTVPSNERNSATSS